MSKKVFRLIVGVTSGVAAIAEAVVAYLNPEYTTAILAAIPVVAGAVTEVCSFFVKEE